MNVYVTGFMGAGKTTVGRLLATFLARPFIDLDQVIESTEGHSIREIFSTRGETGFREIESSILRRLNDQVPVVVAVGGGTLSQRKNKEWVAQQGTTIWLDVPFEVILDRLKKQDQENRPLYESDSKTRALYRRRLADYRDSDLRIEISSSDSAADVAARIRNLLEGN